MCRLGVVPPMKRLVLSTAVLMSLSGVAMAADALGPVAAAPPAPPTPTFSWTGPYVGVFGGYGFGYSSATNDAAITSGIGDGPGGFDDGDLALTLGLSPRGLLGGATVGYNYQSGSVVIGAEASGGYLGLSDAFAAFVADGPNGVLDDDEGTVGYGWYATLSGRVGVALNQTLLFATAGGILTQYSASYGDLDTGVTDLSDQTTLGGPQFGYLLGGGAEFAFDSNWTAKLEYNFVSLGTDTTTNADGDSFTHSNRAHLIRFGLNYLFDY